MSTERPRRTGLRAADDAAARLAGRIFRATCAGWVALLAALLAVKIVTGGPSVIVEAIIDLGLDWNDSAAESYSRDLEVDVAPLIPGCPGKVEC